MRVARTNEALPRSPPSADLPADTAAPPATRHLVGAGRAEAGSPFGAALHTLGREIDRGEALTDQAIRGGGGHASPERLIALQAGIYRYSEAIDLVTKLVDKGTQAVRTTLQNQ